MTTMISKPKERSAGSATAHETLYSAIVPCAIGFVGVAQTNKGIRSIWLGDNPAELERTLRSRFPAAEIVAGNASHVRLAERVARTIDVPTESFDLPLDMRGTPFQVEVWNALRRVPSGTTATYGEIAKMIGRPDAVRAVGTACGANTLAIVVPCHRIVRSDGGLSGYRWGVERKRYLLQREGAIR